MKTIQSIFAFLCLCFVSNAQDISLLKQFNGRYDFTLIGNTLNMVENGTGGACSILTSSSADLNLDPEDEIESVYLYWAGSGLGDFEVKLNDIDVTAQRDFSHSLSSGSSRPGFSAYADVTDIVKATGNATYTLSDLDLTAVIPSYCSTLNFGGWALLVVFKNDNYPLYQLNIYDGLQKVPSIITINLDNLNVIDNENARIGFIAWEGDKALANNETLRINNNVISNPPLNPATNAFNGTNSVTGSDEMFNMDLDIYNIENNIEVGDTSAVIELTSNQDVILINTVITRLNSQLPDATVTLSDFSSNCSTRNAPINLQVNNSNSTDPLPINTPINISINGDLITTINTTTELPIDGTETLITEIVVPDVYGNEFDIIATIDPDDSVKEIIEDNNTSTISVLFGDTITTQAPVDLLVCNTGILTATAQLSQQESDMGLLPGQSLQFFESLNDAENNINPINKSIDYVINVRNKTIFTRIDHGTCHAIDSFIITISDDCLPDATATLQANVAICESRILAMDLSVLNLESLTVLPTNTLISIQINGEEIELLTTTKPLPVGDSQNILRDVTIPEKFGNTFTINAIVDPNLTVDELDDNNNMASVTVEIFDKFNTNIPDMLLCQISPDGFFDLSIQQNIIDPTGLLSVSFHESEDDANDNINAISTDTQYSASNTIQNTIYTRISNTNCYHIESFDLIIKNCLPDASLTLSSQIPLCGSRTLSIDLSIFNTNGEIELPINQPISFTIDGNEITTLSTTQIIPIDGNQNIITQIIIPDSYGNSFDLKATIDTNNLLTELDENNNDVTIPVQFQDKVITTPLPNLSKCDAGGTKATFDLNAHKLLIDPSSTQTISYFTDFFDAINGTNPIQNTSSFEATQVSTTIVVKIENQICNHIESFVLTIEDCRPDATVQLEKTQYVCGERDIDIKLTILNNNSTKTLPLGTTVSLSVDGDELKTVTTTTSIAVDDIEEINSSLTIPEIYGNSVTLTATADPTNNVNELDENNNSTTVDIIYKDAINSTSLSNMTTCNTGNLTGFFDFMSQESELNLSSDETITYYETLDDAINKTNEIISASNFESNEKEKTIYVRIENDDCYNNDSFILTLDNCTPQIRNFISPNGDGKNETIIFNGITNIYTNIEIEIFSRWGQLVWKGNYLDREWNGTSNQGKITTGNDGELPVGTYFYIINLNDPEHAEPLTGYIYLTR